MLFLIVSIRNGIFFIFNLKFHVRVLEEEVTSFKAIVSSFRVISVVVRNTQRQELKRLKVKIIP